MAWCLPDVETRNAHSPRGAFEGFEELLAKYYKEKMTDQYRKRFNLFHRGAYVAQVMRKYRYEVGEIVDHLPVQPLLPHEFPTDFRLGQSYGSLSAWIDLEYGVKGIDERLKAIIEALEPGVHRFWPIRIRTLKGKDYPVRYYGMVIDRFLESFRPEATRPDAVMEGLNSTYSICYGAVKADYNALALSKAAIGGAHVWRERKFTDPNIFISDELKAAIDAAGLTIQKHYQTKSV